MSAPGQYAKISATFWTGETGKALRRRGFEGLLVAAYLITSPHNNMIGLYHLPIPYMGYETALGPEGALKGLQACIDVGFCSYDAETEMVWVHEMAAWQLGESLKAADLRCKGVQKHFDAQPKCPLIKLFFERYAQAFHLTMRNDEGAPIQRSLQLVVQAPYEAPSKPVAVAVAVDKEIDHLSMVSSRQNAVRQACVVEGIAHKAKGPPSCPHLAVLALWAEVMPDMPQHLPTQWKGIRADHLRARWRETAVEKGWSDEGQGLMYLRKFFGWCRQSSFLSGKVSPRQGQRQFELELAWLVNPTNWAKVQEGKYHAGE